MLEAADAHPDDVRDKLMHLATLVSEVFEKDVVTLKVQVGHDLECLDDRLHSNVSTPTGVPPTTSGCGLILAGATEPGVDTDSGGYSREVNMIVWGPEDDDDTDPETPLVDAERDEN